MNVKTVVDSERGCGWRKEGGLYLRLDAAWEPCGKLPIPLEVCPCCHAGIKPARGWTWFDPRPFLGSKECAYALDAESKALHCGNCALDAGAPAKAGLLWIGEKFYPTPRDWMEEAQKLGISRRISAMPQGFKLGDRVYLAHRLCIDHKELCACRGTEGKNCGTCNGEGWVHRQTPGIFTTFVPSRVEYVCKGTETAEELADLEKRGITPVKVLRDTDPAPAFCPNCKLALPSMEHIRQCDGTAPRVPRNPQPETPAPSPGQPWGVSGQQEGPLPPATDPEPPIARDSAGEATPLDVDGSGGQQPQEEP